jgi:hypothetical protein
MFAATRKIADQGPAADNEEVFEVCPLPFIVGLDADVLGGRGCARS